MPRLLIAASGTGGHIFPALSFADSLSNAWEIEWLGVPNRLEIELVPKKYNLIKLKVGGLQGNIFRKMFDLCKLLYASIRVSFLFRQKKLNVCLLLVGISLLPVVSVQNLLASLLYCMNLMLFLEK